MIAGAAHRILGFKIIGVCVLKKSKLDAEECITLFRDSFHVVSQKTFWPKLRGATRIDNFGNAELQVDENGKVGFRSSPLSDDQEAHAATFFRKYISGGDPVYLEKVLEAAAILGIKTDPIVAANETFQQLIAPKWNFRVKDGVAVGMFIEGIPVGWGPDKNLRLLDCEEVAVSFQDFTEVTFNEGMFHAFVPGRNESKRAMVRTVSAPLQKAMSNVALAGTLYASIVLHAEFAKRRAWLCTAESCQEMQILESFVPKKTTTDPTKAVEIDSFGLPRE